MAGRPNRRPARRTAAQRAAGRRAWYMTRLDAAEGPLRQLMVVVDYLRVQLRRTDPDRAVAAAREAVKTLLALADSLPPSADHTARRRVS